MLIVLDSNADGKHSIEMGFSISKRFTAVKCSEYVENRMVCFGRGIWVMKLSYCEITFVCKNLVLECNLCFC